MPLLLVLFIIPWIASAFILALPIQSSRLLKRISFILSLIPFAMLVANHSRWIGSSLNYHWVTPLSIEFYLSVDSLSLLFLYLVAIILPISILAVNRDKVFSPRLLFGLILLLQGLLIGFFTARDLVLFTIFWEAMLLPLYFIIITWGGPQRQNAGLKFIIYMITGSVLMVAAVLALYFASAASTGKGSFNFDVLAQIAQAAPYAPWLCAIFLLAFAVKTPLFPFHAWLPDAYCQAPTAGTILLSALLSKAGIYGILRIGIGFFPLLLKAWSPLLLGLAIVGVFYGALAAWVQKDFKRLIAYSSFSHVNFVLAGLFIWNSPAQSGAILQALNHGITITALFLCSGWLEQRLGTTAFGDVKGLAKFMPHLCWLTLFFVLASVALPGTNNFVGELLIFFGLFGYSSWLAALLALTVILSVVYMLRFMQKIYFEAPSFYQEPWVDIHRKEFLIAAPLIALILWIGIYPVPILDIIQLSHETIPAIAQLEVIR